jgi:peroxiredoxin
MLRPAPLTALAASTALLALLLVAAFAGCQIQKTETAASGSAYVMLRDSSAADSLLSGARIRLDGRETLRQTPALLKNLSVGEHRIGAFKPGYNEVELHVTVHADAVDSAALRTAPVADGGYIFVADAPNGTVLLLNGLPVGAVPVSGPDARRFGPFAIGTFRASVFLPGFITEAPSSWRVSLTSGVTDTLRPVFSAGSVGPQVGNLAPDFALPSDWDTSRIRLSDHRGQVTLVSFFFYNCSACIEEFPYIAAAYEHYQSTEYADQVRFIGVDFVDTYSMFARFREDHPALGITFPLLFDQAGLGAGNAYGVTTCPANFLIDRTGRIQLVTGSIPEAQLYQTIDGLLETDELPTFRFEMADTLIHYSNGMEMQNFVGTVHNLLNADQALVLRIAPLSFPDADRTLGTCIGDVCYAPSPGAQSLTAVLSPLVTDSVHITFYTNITDSSGIPVDSALHGSYTLAVTVYPEAEPEDSVNCRLRLVPAASAGLSAPVAAFGEPFLRSAFSPDHR